jgi:phage anti-repressor protein
MYDIKEKEKYCIEIVNLARWLDVRKDHIKKTLLESYIKNVDYKVIKIKKETTGSGGHNKEQILLTPDCFKLLSMRSQTKKSEKIREYYLELEKLLDKYKDYIIQGISDKNTALLNNQKPKVYPNRGVIYVIQTADEVTLYKIGKSTSFKNRIRNYNADKADDIRPVLIYEADNTDIVEKCLKANMKEFQYRKYKEVYQVNVEIIKKILKECDCSTERITLIKRNKPLKQDGGNMFVMIDKHIA